MSDSYLTPEIMALVGVTDAGRRGQFTAKGIEKYAAAIDDRNPLYFDRAAAQAAGYADVIGPPLYAAAGTRPVPFRDGLLADGQYETAAPPGLTHLQTMLAGQNWELIRPAVAGEEVIETWTTQSITERKGSTGNIVFVDKEATITTLDGELIQRYTNVLILRAAPPPMAAFAAGAVSAPKSRAATIIEGDTLIKNPDKISLFMYCAAIWAVHRIHWDTPYAQSEGLPDAILPGWMVSSYLAQLAEMRAPQGMRLSKINVRYKGMAFPGDTLTCRAAPMSGETGVSLSVTNQSGVEISTGDAAFTAA
jgi:hydroxyacyl-ACP dehydratase HTD2-like protein with hotdog domain